MSNLTNWKSSLREAHSKFVAINPEKANIELGFAMQIINNSDALQKCEPNSIINAIVNVARTSVTLNPVMKLAYLVPRKGKCVLDFSYMGLVAMLRDNNCIKSISAHIVYEDEQFVYDASLNVINHRPHYAKSEEEHKRRFRIGCYSRATLFNGEVVYEFMPMWEIQKVKSLSEGSSNKFSAWQTWEEEMIKKVVIKRHFKMLISLNASEQISNALQIENENNPLIGSFDGKSAVGAKKKPSLMSAFDEKQEEFTNQISFLDEEQEEPLKEISIIESKETKSGAMNMDFSEEEIEAMLEEEANKVKEQPHQKFSDEIDLFPSEDIEDENELNWFPKLKDE